MSDFGLEELIAAPIIAMNEAEAENAARYVELLDNYAFETSVKGGLKKLSTLAFSYARIEADGTASLQSVEIPLIQFLPISGVAIDQAKLNYALKLNPSPEKKSGRLKWFGRLAENTGSETPLSGNINIELHLKQVDVPQGVLSLLEASQQAAHQKTIEAKPLEPVINSVEDVVTEIPDDFVDFEVIDKPDRFIRAGQDYSYKVKANFAEAIRNKELVIFTKLNSQPSGALEFEGESDFKLRDGEMFEVRFLTSPRIEKYKPRTSIAMILTAEIEDTDGKVKTNSQAIKLARPQISPLKPKDR